MKDVVFILLSTILFSSPMTVLQILASLVVLLGVQVFNLVQQKPEGFQGDKGLVGGIQVVAKDFQQKLATMTQGSKEKARGKRRDFGEELDNELDLRQTADLEKATQKAAARAL